MGGVTEGAGLMGGQQVRLIILFFVLPFDLSVTAAKMHYAAPPKYK